MYIKYASSLHAKIEVLNDSFGHKSIQISGRDIGKAFKYESGKHVVQRNPPTENKGRRHTSIVSVAVLPLPPEKSVGPLPVVDVKIETTRGCGPGGQNKNKVESAVRARHLPTGIEVFIDGRDQFFNKCMALRILTERVHCLENEKKQAGYNANRKKVLSDSGRGDKIRTYNFISSRVADHRTGKSTRNIKDVMKGNLGLIV
jgi:peptide chain release factor 1